MPTEQEIRMAGSSIAVREAMLLPARTGIC